jgi:tetratricopeptide (TPR) repeat protein
MNFCNVIIYSLCFMYISFSAAQSANDDSLNPDCQDVPKNQKKVCYEKAVKFYKTERATDSGNLDAWYGESESNYHLGNYAESYKLCDQVLGNINLQGKGGLNEFRVLKADCEIAYEKVTGEKITAGPGDEQPETYQEAFMLYDQAIKQDPNNTRAWNNKGVALAEMDNFTGSIYCFDKVIEIDQTLAEAWNNKGAALDCLGHHSEALAYYDNSTVLNPSLAEAWYNMGRSLNELDMPGAEECYLKGKELDEQLEEEAEFRWLYKSVS